MTEKIQESYRLVQKTTEIGDNCHYDIEDLTDNQAKRFFRQYWEKFEEFRVCNNGDDCSITKEYLENLANQDYQTL